eukprot:TRINITY_DN17552_c0_g2_i1.p1 TRINITY_DN17552_c0_g2~~TRINITY_DN17552_c0_g2_i1.p1  ORF type:complete len:567 (-),score=137.55 TRINITY_DN17552_c0_g2_i1:62-1588(-)
MANFAAVRFLWLASAAVQVSAQLRVLSPLWLSEQVGNATGRIEGATATFGAPYYGDVVFGRVLWGQPRRADAEQHCNEDDYDVRVPDEAKTHFNEKPLINIVMVRRGACAFTTLVHVARHKGAHAVLIVDKADSELTAQDMHRVILADDGTGEDIDIPSVVIPKEDGGRLIEAAQKREVILELSWHIPSQRVVDMEMWMSSGSAKSQQFLQEFSNRRKLLNEVLTFQPFYDVVSVAPGVDQDIIRRRCKDEAGLYCVQASEASGSNGLTGKDILDENVRQLCIHELSKVKRPPSSGDGALLHHVTGAPLAEYAEKYWDYVEKLATECPVDGTSPEKRLSEACSLRLMDEVGLDDAAVLDCAGRWEEKLKYQLNHVAWSSSAVRINGWRYKGKLDADLITRAVCDGFARKPHECKSLIEARTIDGIILSDAEEVAEVSGAFLGSLIVLSSLALAILLLYRTFLRRKKVKLEFDQQDAQDIFDLQRGFKNDVEEPVHHNNSAVMYSRLQD